uniref:Sulfhydryl oxidase n=1 Tax=Tetraselmis sp. GSL018 TaxID=582737 RepID=A0A061SB40_9CHLO
MDRIPTTCQDFERATHGMALHVVNFTKGMQRATSAITTPLTELRQNVCTRAWNIGQELPWKRREPNISPCLHNSGFAVAAPVSATSLRAPNQVMSLSSAPGGPVSQAELGRATWTLLHTTAAQFPERPTRQQQRDARKLVYVLSRTYPCAECAKHFREIIK